MMSIDTCCVCSCALPVERTTVRRADGTVRFVMCNECFDHRFCTTCLVYFANAQGRQVHQCPN